MNYRVSLLARLKSAERSALSLLRGSKFPYAKSREVDPDARSAFSDFRARMQDYGLLAQELDAPTVSVDEFVMLGLLAALQRDRLEPALQGWRSIIPEGRTCARLLKELGYRLDYNNISRLPALAETLGQHIAAKEPEASATPILSPPPSRRLELKSRVYQLLLERGPLHKSEILHLATGVTGELLYALVRQGRIKRLSHGVYDVLHR